MYKDKEPLSKAQLRELVNRLREERNMYRGRTLLLQEEAKKSAGLTLYVVATACKAKITRLRAYTDKAEANEEYSANFRERDYDRDTDAVAMVRFEISPDGKVKRLGPY